LANEIKKSNHFIAFTGAGISTSCGIKDFRSGINTVLKTGAGIWELKAQKIVKPETMKTEQVKILKSVPSKTHMALV
jgi:NAD-dependent SIR2 family protein deacetylase